MALQDGELDLLRDYAAVNAANYARQTGLREIDEDHNQDEIILALGLDPVNLDPNDYDVLVNSWEQSYDEYWHGANQDY